MTHGGDRGAGRAGFAGALAAYITACEGSFGRIDASRREGLGALARWVRGRLEERGEAGVTFICTHNSRRSHLGQVWAQTAAAWYGLGGVRTFSGGTEATAFEPRAVAALERCGFLVERGRGGVNDPVLVRWGEGAGATMSCFSKVYDAAPNPREGFAAVMTCASADEACPVVMGAAARIAIRYEDPKAADGTAEESAVYDARCAQIAREMLYAFSLVG